MILVYLRFHARILYNFLLPNEVQSIPEYPKDFIEYIKSWTDFNLNDSYHYERKCPSSFISFNEFIFECSIVEKDYNRLKLLGQLPPNDKDDYTKPYDYYGVMLNDC